MARSTAASLNLRPRSCGVNALAARKKQLRAVRDDIEAAVEHQRHAPLFRSRGPATVVGPNRKSLVIISPQTGPMSSPATCIAITTGVSHPHPAPDTEAPRGAPLTPADG